MSDLLSAASLYLAVLGLLYSAWYSEIIKATDVKIPTFTEDRGEVLHQLRSTLYSKTFPLSMGATILAVILIPEAMKVISDAVNLFLESGLNAIKFYDPVKSLFIAITLFTIAIAIYSIVLSVKVRLKIKEALN